MEGIISIRKKTILIIGLCIGILVGAIAFISIITVLSGFRNIETENTRINVGRALGELENLQARLKTLIGDWAPWDNTYAFIQGLDDEYISSNLPVSTLINLGINFIGFYDTGGNLHYAAAADLAGKIETAVPVSVLKSVSEIPLLFSFRDLEDTHTGLVSIEDSLAVISSGPIIRSDFTGPIEGTLIMCRYLDEEEIARFRKLTQLEIHVLPLTGGPKPPAPAQSIVAEHNSHRIEISTLNDDSISGESVLKDIQGNEVLRLRILEDRKIYREGKKALQYFFAVLIGLSAVILLLILIMLEQSLLKPLSVLCGELTKIGENEESPGLTPLKRNDEIGSLYESINIMLTQLEKHKLQNLSKTYNQARSESISGMLHNIRNALTPLLGEIHAIIRGCAQVPEENFRKARTELADNVADEGRRAKLIEFIGTGNETLFELFKLVNQKALAMQDAIGEVEEILAAQQKSMIPSVSDESVIADLIFNEALHLSGPERRQYYKVSYVIEESEKGSRVAIPRLTLLQVFQNLLENAFDAMGISEGRFGCIRYGARGEILEGVSFSHVTICDDGSGILPENLERIFSRNFTTKSGSNLGLGLHWSANALTSLGSRIWASSSGPGTGACIHLMLKKQPQKRQRRKDGKP